MPVTTLICEVPPMTDIDIERALRTAITLLMNAVESHRMPSGEPLTPEGVERYVQTIEQLEDLLGGD
jgi:hypothetical protein